MTNPGLLLGVHWRFGFEFADDMSGRVCRARAWKCGELGGATAFEWSMSGGAAEGLVDMSEAAQKRIWLDATYEQRTTAALRAGVYAVQLDDITDPADPHWLASGRFTCGRDGAQATSWTVSSSYNGDAIGLVPGPVGPAGVEPRGDWDEATDYVSRDLVEYTGKLWRALEPSTGVEPGTDPSKWTVFFGVFLTGKGIAGASYEVIPTDDGLDLWFAQACAVTFSPELHAGFACSGVQVGTGQVAFPFGVNPEGFTKTYGQGSCFMIKKDPGGVRVFGSLV